MWVDIVGIPGCARKGAHHSVNSIDMSEVS
jgi:hypothetical protein